ncbi:hypothetical protein QE366_002586 [Nocardioides zeae]|nr:hypothetical protein [Nocardioides zeae]MDR6175327.1 hypothetical protein [Nocardioides zeae]
MVTRSCRGWSWWARERAAEDDGDDLLRRQRLVGREVRVAAGEGEEAEHPCHLARRHAEGVGVRLHELDDRLQRAPPRGERVLVVVPGTPRRSLDAECRHDAEDLPEATLHDRRRGDEARLERQRAVDRLELLEKPGRVERRVEHRVEQVLLRREDPEHGALRDAGRLGDLARRRGLPPLEDERHRRLEDGAAAFVGRHRRRSGAHNRPE